MSRPRVLLVDDDASIRRFVAMALEDLDLDLLCAASVPEAVATLRTHGPVALVVTDLMMPGEGGLALLQRFADEPALRAGARLVVFSAGLNAAVQHDLAPHDVWQQLMKPVSARALIACVEAAVAAGPASTATPRGAPPGVAPDAPVGGPDTPGALAIRRHFGGDRALYFAFRAGCLTQFVADVARGDASLQGADLADLRHLGHSLKSVLTLLGEPALSEVARQLEAAAAAAQADAAASAWAVLRPGLSRLAGDRTEERPAS